MIQLAKTRGKHDIFKMQIPCIKATINHVNLLGDRDPMQTLQFFYAFSSFILHLFLLLSCLKAEFGEKFPNALENLCIYYWKVPART